MKNTPWQHQKGHEDKCLNHEHPTTFAVRDGLCNSCWIEAEPYLYPRQAY